MSRHVPSSLSPLSSPSPCAIACQTLDGAQFYPQDFLPLLLLPFRDDTASFFEIACRLMPPESSWLEMQFASRLTFCPHFYVSECVCISLSDMHAVKNFLAKKKLKKSQKFFVFWGHVNAVWVCAQGEGGEDNIPRAFVVENRAQCILLLFSSPLSILCYQGVFFPFHFLAKERENGIFFVCTLQYTAVGENCMCV